MRQLFPDIEAFTQVDKELRAGNRLTMCMLGDIFGEPFWELQLCSLLDARDAARILDKQVNGEYHDDGTVI